MTHTVWRIATDTPSYEADDLSGEGAKITGGRWNEVGSPAVYCSESRALACLETIVHLDGGGLPLNRYLVAIEIPIGVWSRAERESDATLKVGWDAEPAGRVSVAYGTDWLNSRTSALLFVPSAIVREEYNILINPMHPDAIALKATKMRKWVYDARLSNSV